MFIECTKNYYISFSSQETTEVDTPTKTVTIAPIIGYLCSEQKRNAENLYIIPMVIPDGQLFACAYNEKAVENVWGKADTLVYDINSYKSALKRWVNEPSQELRYINFINSSFIN